jgi:signal transduction histidine kinase
MENSIDITDRKLSEIELIRAKEKAEESDKLKSAFLANVSHEIRTPLNAIVGFLNILNSDRNFKPESHDKYVKLINSNSARLVKLIDGIIDIAKIEVGQLTLLHTPLHVNNLMDELKIFFDTSLYTNGKENIELVLDDSAHLDSCVASIDAMRLRQILDNLLENAIKFTEKGFIRFGYRQPSPDMLEFFVEDSGIGLSHDQLEVIFERFRQTELTNTRFYGGIGLGLTISRSLVQLMGGKMWVESTKDRGAAFYFTVPYKPVSEEKVRI